VGNGLRTQARRVLLQQVAPAYHQASGSQKQHILEEFVTATGYARKYAQRLLNHSEEVFAQHSAVAMGQRWKRRWCWPGRRSTAFARNA
jgi:hypothetical protein